ncbi:MULTISPECIES: carbohydrate-binding protein [unclassified Streptomyces]|uniref:carbohydrate-binding protein n=1 Tax=unclassified Streptomyces TaxID=2593676 RepID=UPI000C273C09|nr:carbohydrate-binding protein [Streptomyces sp. CB01373]PJM95101.1 carbohydrate-binding protein [Streptomyces sp. CB01373]
MTPGNSGASTPEDDDPFGYLYADGQANGAQPPSGGYGYPNAVNRVHTVGQRQYGQQPPTAPQGQVPQQQGAYGRPNAHYAAPEALPGGAPTGRQSGQGGGRGPNTKGLLIGAVAVVAAVVIGIGVAMLNDDSGDKGEDTAGGPAPTATKSSEPSPSTSASAETSGELPKIDAKALSLEGGARTATDFKGSKADGGVYVADFNQVGAKATWTVDGIRNAGSYRLNVRYGIPGVDANATLAVNGKDASQTLSMKNFSHMPEGDWEKGWQTTWALVNLNQGTNTIEIACNDGNQCNAVLDQVWLSKG